MLKNIVLLSSLTSVLFLFGCGKSLEKDVVGKWAYEMSIPMDDKEMAGQIILKCVSNFLPNKSLDHDCNMKASGSMKDGSSVIEMQWRLRATGDWTVTDKTVYVKTIDSKFEPTMSSVKGDPISNKYMLEKIQKGIESPFIKGETATYVTVSNDGKKWVYETELEKKKVTVTATKQ